MASTREVYFFMISAAVGASSVVLLVNISQISEY